MAVSAQRYKRAIPPTVVVLAEEGVRGLARWDITPNPAGVSWVLLLREEVAMFVGATSVGFLICIL